MGSSFSFPVAFQSRFEFEFTKKSSTNRDCIQNMKIAIYSPYLDTFGGGEKYMMAIAEALSQEGSVDVLLDLNLGNLGAEYLKDTLSKRFNLNLGKVNFIKAPVGDGSNSFERLFFLKSYDILFYLTDGSIFYPTSKRSILHIQSPLVGETKSLWRRFKLNGWNLIIYNSRFTKEHAEDDWPLPSRIIYPPVDVERIRPLKKKSYILSVGRFFGYLRDKKHEVLIRVFKEMYKSKSLKEWSLHLVGSAGEGDKDYLEDLARLAKEVPVKFYPNLEYGKLIKLYGESSIYWHASGFAEDDPTKMEHFGISTVEAMAGGCVPIVVGKGGLKEIVTEGKNGFFWETLEQLMSKTLDLIHNEKLLGRLSKEAQVQSHKFDRKKFVENIRQLVTTNE